MPEAAELKPGAKARLRKVLTDEVQGKRTCVLVLGDGVNLQAGAAQRSNAASQWNRVLEAIWREAHGPRDGLHEAGSSTALLWSALVRQWAEFHRIDQVRSEQAVRARVCARFQSIERSRNSPRSLYRMLLDGRFANVVSFNVDRRLVLQSGGARIVQRGAAESFLECRIEVFGPRGKTNIWYPYGHTGRRRSIQIGYSTYEHRLRALEASRAMLMEKNYHWDYGYGPGLMQPNSAYEGLWARPQSWCDLFFTAPLVFVGTSLPADDWPVWWLLHQRARYFVPFETWQHPDTFFLATTATSPRHVQNGAAQIEIVLFRNHDMMWNFVEESLNARGIDRHPGFLRKFSPSARDTLAKSHKISELG